MVFVTMAEETNRIATSWRQRKDAQYFSSGIREIKVEPADPSPRKNNSPKMDMATGSVLKPEKNIYITISLSLYPT